MIQYLCDAFKIIVHEVSVANPARWITSIVIPLLFIKWGLRKKSLSFSGAATGFLVGFIMTISNYGFLACLAAFFISSSKATKYKSHIKKKFEENFKEGGQRNWEQIIANGLAASIFALIYMKFCGCSEQPINIHSSYQCSQISLGVIGAYSCANGDTWASELGTVLTSQKPILITTFKRVPKGTNGGISLPGLAVSFLGGVIVALAYNISMVICGNLAFGSFFLQWQLYLIGGLAGLFGSIIDSVLGATLQYSGINKRNQIVETPAKDVVHISGKKLLNNHSVNLLSTLLTALATPYIAMVIL